MFDITKFIIEFKAKLIMAVVLILLATAAYFAWTARGDKIEKQHDVIIAQNIENGGLKETVKDQVASGVITEKVSTEAVVEKQKVVATHEKVQARTIAKVKKIEEGYDAMPKTPENATAMDNETSAAMIDGLWDSYCAGEAGALRCAVKAAPPLT